jgi:hypothetical protein
VRTGLAVLVAWILLSVPFGIMVGRWLARTGREYPEPRCACPLALDAERILQDGRLCSFPPDGRDGLCSVCREECIPLVDAIQRKAPHGI